VLQAAAALGRPLFVLFNHPAARVADGTAVIMRAIAERGAAAAAPMRDAALREGAILHHLQLALFASGGPACCCCFESNQTRFYLTRSFFLST
jgi:DnaJ family protein C protein 13